MGEIMNRYTEKKTTDNSSLISCAGCGIMLQKDRCLYYANGNRFCYRCYQGLFVQKEEKMEYMYRKRNRIVFCSEGAECLIFFEPATEKKYIVSVEDLNDKNVQVTLSDSERMLIEKRTDDREYYCRVDGGKLFLFTGSLVASPFPLPLENPVIVSLVERRWRVDFLYKRPFLWENLKEDVLTA